MMVEEKSKAMKQQKGTKRILLSTRLLILMLMLLLQAHRTVGWMDGLYKDDRDKEKKLKFEYACQVLPYRTFYAGGRCFIAITSITPLQNPCAQIFIKDGLGTTPKLASIDSQDLLMALKQSDVFDPSKSYQVSVNVDGSNVFMSSSQQMSSYSYLCESTAQEVCPQGFEMWNGRCYRFFSEPQTFEDAANICAQISAFSTMAIIEDEETNRFLASYARSFVKSNDDKGMQVWVGITYINDEYWADVRNFDANDKLSFYRWFTTADGMYTQATNHPASSNNAVYLYTTTTNSNGNTWFAYWGTTNGAREKHAFFCELRPVPGIPTVQIIPARPGTIIILSPQMPVNMPPLEVIPAPLIPQGPIKIQFPFPLFSNPTTSTPSQIQPEIRIQWSPHQTEAPLQPPSEGGITAKLEQDCHALNAQLKIIIDLLSEILERMNSLLHKLKTELEDMDSCDRAFDKIDDLGSTCKRYEMDLTSCPGWSS